MNMALNGLLDIQISVPNPQELFEFWLQHGMNATAEGVLGTTDRPVQMNLVEAPYRHLSSMHLSCENESDIVAIAKRLTDAGVTSSFDSTTLRCVDPIFGHAIVIDVGSPHPLTPTQSRAFNGPGQRTRIDTRADAVLHTESPVVRRIGHVVLGTPHLVEATDFYLNVLGYRVSDQIMKGFATFMRVESDHHNLMIQPGPTSYLNHYAVEVDDIDAVGLAGTSALKDERVSSLGRMCFGTCAILRAICLNFSLIWIRSLMNKVGPEIIAVSIGKVKMDRLVSRYGVQKIPQKSSSRQLIFQQLWLVVKQAD
jgi:hypothetical protein